ncbi:phage major capsid protein [Massilia sp. 9096]|uniref:phage major capsid protein n=1 Tax=Massilia sp. 9096 TaxID=1500894 RepID=UPI00055F78DB|nr:phage major capsid protein [Massilia sp. 9096]
MSKLAQLRAQRDAVAKKANDLNNKYPADQRMPAAEAAQLDTILAEVEAIDAEIAREQRMATLAGENPQAQHEAALNAATRDPSKISDESKALRAFLGGGMANLSADDRNRMLARQNPDIRAAMSTTTATEGGYTTSPEYQRSLETAMKAYGGMRSVGTPIRTATGVTMNFPTSDATAEIGEIVGQNGGASTLNTAFGNATLDVYKYSSKAIALPFELVQDSFIDIEGYVQSVLAMRLGRITNNHFTVGSGSGQPRGIITAANVGRAGATGQTASITYDDLVELEHSVDPAYRNAPGVGYMFHDQSLKVIRKLKDNNARPIFVPGYEEGNPGGAPDRLLGRAFAINQDMPVMAANAKSIAFGQLSKYLIRDVMDLTLFRMTDSAFTMLGQIGFLAFMRSGGNLIDVGGAVKTYQNSAT